MDFSELNLLIIAGGQSSRMKQDKRLIEIDGIGLLERILTKATKQNFSKVYLCVEDTLPFIEDLAYKYNAEILCDKFSKAGPMGGLTEGLANISTEWAFAVSCDMPFFEFETVTPLMNYLANYKVVMFDHQPLAAFYHKSMAENFQKALADNQRKLRFIINQVPNYVVDLKQSDVFFNVNSPADLKLARGRAANVNRKIPIISIVAPSSGTGKTTFIEKLIPKLNEKNVRVGVVKSDAHGFNLDVEGKDTWRFNQAGAESVAIVSPNGWLMIQNTESRADFLQVAEKMNHVDLILTESRTHGIMPAISLYRGLGEPLINESVAAIFTDRQIEANDISQFELNDIEQATRICLFLMGRSA